MFARIVAILVVAWTGTVVRCAEPATPDQLAKDLGSPTYQVREKAGRDLWKLGETARTALEAVAKGDNLEAATRAEAILEKFNWGIYADTPASTLEQITQFRNGTFEDQWSIIKSLVDGDPKAYPTLRRLIGKSFAGLPNQELPQSTIRSQMYARLQNHLRTKVPLMLMDGKMADAENLLSLYAFGPNISGQLDYAIVVVLNKKLKPTIEHWERQRKTGDHSLTTQLIILHHLNGEGSKALKLLADLPPNELFTKQLRESILVDLGDWKTLCDEPVDMANSITGLKIFRMRMAGKADEAKTMLDDIKEQAGGLDRSRSYVDEVTLALLLNNRTLDGIERLKSQGSAPHIMADMMISRLEFQSAMDLINAGIATVTKAEAAPMGNEQEMLQLYTLKRARIMAQLGDRSSAGQIFTKLNEEALVADMRLITNITKAEMRSGFYDLAAELLGKYHDHTEVSQSTSRNSGTQDPFEVVFDNDAEAAYFWWKVMKSATPEESASARMRNVRELVIGKMKPEKLAEWLKSADKLSSPDPYSLAGHQRAIGLATAYRILGKRDEAVAALAVVADAWAKGIPTNIDTTDLGTRSWTYGIDEKFRLWMELGDLLMELKKPDEAAKRYEQGWRRYPDNATLMYLSGVALLETSKADEGKRRIDLSHYVSLSNSRPRGRFLEELVTRGVKKTDLETARDLTRKCAWLYERSVGNVWNQVGRASISLKDYNTAVISNQRAVHYVLRTSNVAYIEGSAYINVPTNSISLNARKLYFDGKVEEALKLAGDVTEVMPGHHDAIMGIVSEMNRTKNVKDADTLFRKGWDPLAALVKKYPDSAWARYQAAWLAAACQRELDTALEYAKKAVELEPQNTSYRECLAEVHFRKGQRDEAKALMTKLLAEEPRSWNYQRQLKRYTSAEFDSPLPSSAID